MIGGKGCLSAVWTIWYSMALQEDDRKLIGKLKGSHPIALLTVESLVVLGETRKLAKKPAVEDMDQWSVLAEVEND